MKILLQESEKAAAETKKSRCRICNILHALLCVGKALLPQTRISEHKFNANFETHI